MPPCPMAIPSSTAMVLNSRGTAPAACTASATTCPTSRRCTWPGTNSVKLLATATIGLPISSRATPLARMSARAPALFLPCVTGRGRSGGMCPGPPHRGGASPDPRARPRPAVWSLQRPGGRAPAGCVWRPGRPGAPARQFTCSVPGGKHLSGGRVDPLDLLPVEPQRGTGPRVLAQVLTEPPAAEHVDATHAGDGPRDGGPVDHHDGLDDEFLPESGTDQPLRLVRRPAGLAEPVRLGERAVIEISPLGRADRQSPVPPLVVHRVDATRADDEMVDVALAPWGRARMQGAVPGPVQPGQPPPGAPVCRRGPEGGGNGRTGPRAVDGVRDGDDGRDSQAQPPVGHGRDDDAGHGRGHGTPDPPGHPGIAGEPGPEHVPGGPGDAPAMRPENPWHDPRPGPGYWPGPGARHDAGGGLRRCGGQELRRGARLSPRRGLRSGRSGCRLRTWIHMSESNGLCTQRTELPHKDNRSEERRVG